MRRFRNQLLGDQSHYYYDYGMETYGHDIILYYDHDYAMTPRCTWIQQTVVLPGSYILIAPYLRANGYVGA